MTSFGWLQFLIIYTRKKLSLVLSLLPLCIFRTLPPVTEILWEYKQVKNRHSYNILNHFTIKAIHLLLLCGCVSIFPGVFIEFDVFMGQTCKTLKGHCCVLKPVLSIHDTKRFEYICMSLIHRNRTVFVNNTTQEMISTMTTEPHRLHFYFFARDSCLFQL